MENKFVLFGKFVFQVLLIFICLQVLAYLLPETWIHKYFKLLNVFYFILALKIHALHLFGSTKRNPEETVGFIFGGMFLRVFFSLFLVAMLVFKYELTDEKVFGLNFLITYLIYTWFEIYTFIPNLRANSTSSTNSNTDNFTVPK